MTTPDPFGLRINLSLHHVVRIEAKVINDGGVSIIITDDRAHRHVINTYPDLLGPLVLENPDRAVAAVRGDRG